MHFRCHCLIFDLKFLLFDVIRFHANFYSTSIILKSFSNYYAAKDLECPSKINTKYTLHNYKGHTSLLNDP